MSESVSLAAEDCKCLEPMMFVVNHGAGEKLSDEVRAMLDPVEAFSFCELPKEKATELHFHDRDEHWQWASGSTVLTIRLPDGRSDQFEISSGWIVYCVRGVEHGHEPLEDWSCFECIGVSRPGARPGHLTREL